MKTFARERTKLRLVSYELLQTNLIVQTSTLTLQILIQKMCQINLTVYLRL